MSDQVGRGVVGPDGAGGYLSSSVPDVSESHSEEEGVGPVGPVWDWSDRPKTGQKENKIEKKN